MFDWLILCILLIINDLSSLDKNSNISNLLNLLQSGLKLNLSKVDSIKDSIDTLNKSTIFKKVIVSHDNDYRVVWLFPILVVCFKWVFTKN